ncbi:hypothetical protein AB0J52_32475 [Spirillospora sp. NPDC049652]
MTKLAACLQTLKKLYKAEDNSSGTAAMTAFQRFGNMVDSEGKYNEMYAKATFAQCGVPAAQYNVGITLIQGTCKMKPAIKKGKGAAYWEKLMRCLVEQGDKLGTSS